MKVLFVCVGNTCRSPMAEGVMKDLVTKKRLDWEVDSAALKEWNIGRRPDIRCLKVLWDHGLDTNHFGRKITKKDFQEFDYILAMDEHNLSELKKFAKRKKGCKHAKLELLGQYHRFKEDAIIQDPYFRTGMRGFECAYSQIVECCKNFVAEHTLAKFEELCGP